MTEPTRSLAEAEGPYHVESCTDPSSEGAGYERIVGPGIEGKWAEHHGFEDEEVALLNTAFVEGEKAALARHEAREVVAWGCVDRKCHWIISVELTASEGAAQERHDADRTEPWMCRARVRSLVEG